MYADLLRTNIASLERLNEQDVYGSLGQNNNKAVALGLSGSDDSLFH